MRTDIKNRQEFDRYLIEATAKMRALVARIPGDGTLEAILRQLEAIQQWTANGQTMTRGQVAKIFMGLQASREMADFPVEQDLVLALNNYLEEGDWH